MAEPTEPFEPSLETVDTNPDIVAVHDDQLRIVVARDVSLSCVVALVAPVANIVLEVFNGV